MPSVLAKIFYSLLWAAVGALVAWFSLSSLKTQAERLQPGNEDAYKQLPRMMVGRILRLILVGVVLYIAVRMGALYALVFVVALTLTTWLQVLKLNREANRAIKPTPREEDKA